MVGNVCQRRITTQGDFAEAGALAGILMAIIVGMVLVYVRTVGTEELV